MTKPPSTGVKHRIYILDAKLCEKGVKLISSFLFVLQIQQIMARLLTPGDSVRLLTCPISHLTLVEYRGEEKRVGAHLQC